MLYKSSILCYNGVANNFINLKTGCTIPFFNTSYLFIFCFKVYDGIVSQQSEVLEWSALALRAHFLFKGEER